VTTTVAGSGVYALDVGEGGLANGAARRVSTQSKL